MPIVPFDVENTAVDGLVRLQAKEVSDDRGTVRELFRASAFAEAGGALAGLGPWRQVNLTSTRRGGVRGLHGEAVTKLVGVAAGEAFGVWLDARRSSATYGRVVTAALTVGVQYLVPPGVCNGFQATGPSGCEYLYCFDAEWRPDMEGVGVHPLDPDLAIAWPLPIDQADPAQLSAKDAAQRRFSELA